MARVSDEQKKLAKHLLHLCRSRAVDWGVAELVGAGINRASASRFLDGSTMLGRRNLRRLERALTEAAWWPPAKSESPFERWCEEQPHLSRLLGPEDRAELESLAEDLGCFTVKLRSILWNRVHDALAALEGLPVAARMVPKDVARQELDVAWRKWAVTAG